MHRFPGVFDDSLRLDDRPSFPDVSRRSRQGWRDTLADPRGWQHPQVVDFTWEDAERTRPALEPQREPWTSTSDHIAELRDLVRALTAQYSDALFDAPTVDSALGPIHGFGVGLSEETERRLQDDVHEDFGAEVAADSSPVLVVYAEAPLTEDDARRLLMRRAGAHALRSRSARVRVVVTGVARAASRTRRCPVCAGCSISHYALDDDCGTFGALVVGRSGRRAKRLLVLSNAHVLAPFGVGRRGDSILHPGRLDQGTEPSDRIALLERIAAPRIGRPNVVDAATARANPKLVCPGVLRDSSRGPSIIRPPSAVVEPLVGMGVRKHGRTTGTTRGFIRAVYLTKRVRYDAGTMGFVDQLDVVDRARQPQPLGDPGDSGAVLWSYHRGRPAGAVGLLTAIAWDQRRGRNTVIANRIGDVLRALDVALYP